MMLFMNKKIAGVAGGGRSAGKQSTFE
jgi:hypothetical protein